MSAMTTLSAPASELYRAWQALRAEKPRLRARDAAQHLDVSEAELTASRLGVDAVRLRPEWAALLPALGELGPIMALTRNEHCVHERKGPYQEVTVSGNGQMGLVVSPDIDLRLFLGGWGSVFAIGEETAHGTQRSIQVFDRQGTAVHKVFLTEHSDVAAWAPLVERFRAEEQSERLELRPAEAKAAPLADGEIDVASLRQGWAALKDTHHFFALLKKHKAERTQALRLAGREWAEPLDVAELPRLLEAASQARLPIMIFVGNAHCIQIHTGTVDNPKWLDDWFNVLDPQFNLHLKTSGVRELWRVRKPSSDGIVTSWEAFDADGELVLQVFGARKPGVPELQEWRSLAESFAAI
ncbi:hemin-degrading factor [Pseudomonas sp. UMC631]|uniref:hemin-degrading factor n=2 Tax=Pseudomonas TaxID=286 RepID=UPI0003E58823|nr:MULTISPECIES: hemin-degrading factor [unclassified Pseudomonas]NTX92336.1 hemin-degrading factor [Pseudomonas sp. UMA643]NTY21612.1 hemin-degrading factor [Pseudomonas sp. UMC3103]NTY27865.1 hemin-degrading factor [Pseudomonas sp. UMA603]NTY32098.1 hemin-degrading factor [Pseudomonas sp. UMC3129]NTY56828.1 hemin-degrading factor [Pseudomonas sp. UMC631]NTY67230.1 hemin-degrading factor [Pseudomonas sp. UMC3106]NUA34967.1 hemin-degrading factor [Pseudomonas sp. UMA601]